MDTMRFVSEFRAAARELMNAVDRMQSCINQYGDLGEAGSLDPYFANTTPSATDPVTKEDILAAGGAANAVVAVLGAGPTSNRARLNKLR